MSTSEPAVGSFDVIIPRRDDDLPSGRDDDFRRGVPIVPFGPTAVRIFFHSTSELRRWKGVHAQPSKAQRLHLSQISLNLPRLTVVSRSAGVVFNAMRCKMNEGGLQKRRCE